MMYADGSIYKGSWINNQVCQELVTLEQTTGLSP